MVRLEARPPNIEGKGEVAIRDLVRNALRMRPDRIIVGEVRGGEALDMLQAMNTGHEGSLSTVHANTPRDALARLETMVLMAGIDLPTRAIREQVASAIDLIVHISRLRDGSRGVTDVTEVDGMEGDLITLQDLFRFDYAAGIGRRRPVPRRSASPPACGRGSAIVWPTWACRCPPISSVPSMSLLSRGASGEAGGRGPRAAHDAVERERRGQEPSRRTDPLISRVDTSGRPRSLHHSHRPGRAEGQGAASRDPSP